jgi:hypothetical protein
VEKGVKPCNFDVRQGCLLAGGIPDPSTAGSPVVFYVRPLFGLKSAQTAFPNQKLFQKNHHFIFLVFHKANLAVNSFEFLREAK